MHFSLFFFARRRFPGRLIDGSYQSAHVSHRYRVIFRRGAARRFRASHGNSAGKVRRRRSENWQPDRRCWSFNPVFCLLKMENSISFVNRSIFDARVTSRTVIHPLRQIAGRCKKLPRVKRRKKSKNTYNIFYNINTPGTLWNSMLK